MKKEDALKVKQIVEIAMLKPNKEQTFHVAARRYLRLSFFSTDVEHMSMLQQRIGQTQEVETPTRPL